MNKLIIMPDVYEIEHAFDDVGQTYNSERGVDGVYQNGTTFVQVHYRYGDREYGWIIYKGKFYEEDDWQSADSAKERKLFE